MRTSTSRFLVAAILIAAVAVLLHARGRSEVFPPRLSFNQFPAAWDGWSGTDIPIDQATLDVLGHGDFLHRDYRNQSEQADVDLLLAYIPSQARRRCPPFPEKLPSRIGLDSDCLTAASPCRFPATNPFPPTVT